MIIQFFKWWISHKEIYPYQPMCFWLVSKSIIFTTIISTILCDTMAITTYGYVFIHKVVLSFRCDYDLWTLLVWTKMKMGSILLIGATPTPLNLCFFIVFQRYNWNIFNTSFLKKFKIFKVFLVLLC